jgi:hypothetical protein
LKSSGRSWRLWLLTSALAGSHLLYARPGVAELVNMQTDGTGKVYQVRQFLALVERHNWEIEDEE